jgi:hypothetical protein
VRRGQHTATAADFTSASSLLSHPPPQPSPPFAAAAAVPIISSSVHAARAVSWQGVLPGTNIFVDDFRPATIARFRESPIGRVCGPLFFLSHAHADHTRGLHASWDGGRIYATQHTKVLFVAEHSRWTHVDVRVYD